MSKMRFILVVASAFLLPNASAAVFDVNLADDLPDAKPGDGKCSFLENPPPYMATCTLRAALMEANATFALDHIQLSNGVHYTLTIPGSGEDGAATGDLDILYPTVIHALWSDDKPVIDANGIDRAFEIHPSAAGSQLVALEITGGVTKSAGGGILSNADQVALFLLDVHTNDAGSGCGIYSRGDTRIIASNIYENASSRFDRCAGVLHASPTNGALWFEASSAFRNQGDGVVIDRADARSTIQNSTLSGNAYYGLWLRDSNVSILSSTLADNGPKNGDGVGGGMHSILSDPKKHEIIMKNTVLDGNHGLNCAIQDFYEGDMYRFYWNVSDDGFCDHDKIIASNNLHFTPAHLWHLNDWGGPTLTHKPDYHSPVIDRTLDSLACYGSEHDQRFLKRRFAFYSDKAYCDTGAVELQW